jgi:hypothetical protein
LNWRELDTPYLNSSRQNLAHDAGGAAVGAFVFQAFALYNDYERALYAAL